MQSDWNSFKGDTFHEPTTYGWIFSIKLSSLVQLSYSHWKSVNFPTVPIRLHHTVEEAQYSRQRLGRLFWQTVCLEKKEFCAVSGKWCIDGPHPRTHWILTQQLYRGVGKKKIIHIFLCLILLYNNFYLAYVFFTFHTAIWLIRCEHKIFFFYRGVLMSRSSVLNLYTEILTFF